VSSPTPTSRFTPDRLRHSLLSQGGAQVFKLLVSIGIGGWMARYLGPQNLGTLSYVAALVGLLGPLGSLGVNGSLSAMLCEERPLPGLLGSALLIEIVGTLVIAVVLIPFAWAARDPVVVGLIGLGVVGNLLGSSEVFQVELLNRQQGTQLAQLGTIQTIAGAFLSVTALLAQAPLLVFGSLPVIQAGIGACLLAVAAQAAKPVQLLKQASWETIRALVKRGLPLLLAGLSVALYMKSDQVMLEWLRGPADVGQYSVSVKVAESLYFLPVVLSNTFLPRIGRGSGQFDSDAELRQLYRSAWLLGVGMTLASMFLLPPLVPIVFGDEFLPAQAALVWLGPAAFAVATGCASGAWLNRQGHQKLIAQRSVIGALVNIGLNFLLIPSMGLTGAALATSVSYLASVYLVGILRAEISTNLINLVFPFRHAAVQG
jgi:PST family polysaccharide transporter